MGGVVCGLAGKGEMGGEGGWAGYVEYVVWGWSSALVVGHCTISVEWVVWDSVMWARWPVDVAHHAREIICEIRLVGMGDVVVDLLGRGGVGTPVEEMMPKEHVCVELAGGGGSGTGGWRMVLDRVKSFLTDLWL